MSDPRPPDLPDDALDDALSLLGETAGTRPLASAQDILARAAAPPPPRAAGVGTWKTLGAVAAALVLGFAAGSWWQGRGAPEPAPRSATPAAQPALAPVEGAPAGPPDAGLGGPAGGEAGPDPRGQVLPGPEVPVGGAAAPGATRWGDGRAPGVQEAASREAPGLPAPADPAPAVAGEGGGRDPSGSPTGPLPLGPDAGSGSAAPGSGAAPAGTAPRAELLALDEPARGREARPKDPGHATLPAAPGGSAHRLALGLGAQGALGDGTGRGPQAGVALGVAYSARFRPEARRSPLLGAELELDAFKHPEGVRPVGVLGASAGLSWELGELRVDAGLGAWAAALGTPRAEEPGPEQADPRPGGPQPDPRVLPLAGPTLAISVGPASGVRVRAGAALRVAPSGPAQEEARLWPSFTVGVVVPLGRGSEEG